jgi:predicted dithiol-disulfide oxidoreductase (DUF899 family)
MTNHKIVSRDEWTAAREQLLVREKDRTRLSDELARKRRELPWVRVEKEYRLETVAGTRTLEELFDGREPIPLPCPGSAKAQPTTRSSRCSGRPDLWASAVVTNRARVRAASYAGARRRAIGDPGIRRRLGVPGTARKRSAAFRMTCPPRR